jgi:glyoxylase-like metal-dependent hydrolase (beta-lactamase superfamily II)
MQRTFEVIDGLYIFDLIQPMEGFEKFLSAWFFRDNMGRRILVETGPPSTIPLLIDELSKLTDELDYILLTHIHIDHSGGLGHLLKKYGNAKVFVSSIGHKHLVSPERFWNASLVALGDVAKCYGEPTPVPSNVFMNEEDGFPGVEVYKAPGHAPHHLAYRIPYKSSHLLFVGETVGMTVPGTEHMYLRPTSPPKFDVQAALSTLDLLSSISTDDYLLCFGHYGSEKNARQVVIKAKEQLLSWIDNVTEWHKNGIDKEKMIDLFINNDPLLVDFKNLPKHFQSRERIFIDHSVQGLIDWVDTR